MDGDPRKTAILVAGMHRSGTSAVSRILNLLGCTLPKTLSSAGPDNPSGFWESMAVKELNERILASAGSAWDDWEPFDARWYESPIAEQFRDRARTTLADEFGDSRLFVLKDPRICRLLPFWIDSLGDFGAEPFIVTPVRNPLDVAMSIEVRNGIDRSIGLLLWLRHHLDAEVTTRHRRRVYVRYERLISEPHAIADEMSDGLGIVWPRRSTDSNIEIDDFLSSGLRHHRTGDDAFLGNPRLSSWIRDSFEIFDRWASGGHSDADQTTLDGIRSTFNAATPAFGRALAVGVMKSHEVEDTLRERLANEERRGEELTTELNSAREEIATTTSAAEQLERRGEELTTELNSAREEIATTTSAAEQLERRGEELTTELNSAREEIATTTSAAEQLERRGEELTTELNSAREEIATTTSAAEQLERRGEELTTELNSAKEEIATTSSALGEHKNHIVVQSMELKERDKKISELSAALNETHARAGALDRELQEIRTSTTWRFTGPVRHAGTRAKQLVQIMGSLFRILRSPRSTRDILRRAPTIVRNEGYAGLKRRLHRVVDPGAPFPEFAGPHDGANVEFRVPDATSEPDIFVLSIIDWDFRFQRSQHLAIELANSGRRVFYFEMMRHAGDRSIAKIRDNLYRIRLSSRSIGYLQPYFGQADDEQKTAWFEEFCAICDVVQATAFKQVIVQHPYWWQFARSLPPEFQLIHDCMDDISGFSNTDDFVLEMERDMTRNCDILVVSSDALHEKYKDIQAPRLIRNAVNIEHLSNDKATNHGIFKQNYPSLQLQLKSTPSADCEVIRIGYVGAIAEWFDADLVRQVAMKEPHYEFHLCGDVSSKGATAALSDLDNVTMYGEIGYRDVPSFLRRMDVLIIPFKITPIIEACDPVKFYEYSAVGKPTVATPLPELNRVSDLVYLASSAEEFRQKIRNAFDRRGDRDFTSALQEYARRNTWHQRGRDFLEALEDFPLISVIVLSYGDAEFTKAAIRSLFERGATYPNLEILVVDNGSPRAEVEKIRECAGKYRGVRVVENEVNLGFSKGNNVGLAQVQGEYVLMLNNDTYVAPGAAYAMARHLARNPKIGAVGSLTNNIGNEARIAVQYENMEQMRRTARQLTWGYRSRNFSVKALGYFAVMFRRRDLECFGLLPEAYGLGMFEDDDHSRTIQAKGYITAVAEDAFVHHHLSASFGTWDTDAKQALFERNRSIFERKWGAWTPHEYRTSRPERVL